MEYKIFNTELVQEEQTLFLKIFGQVTSETSERIRVVAVFDGESERRRILCQTEQVYDEDTGREMFVAQSRVQLPFVFYGDGPVGQVSLYFELQNSYETVVVEESHMLDAGNFERQQGKKRLGFRVYRWFSFFVYTLLLPMSLLDGYFALRGEKELDTGENTNRTGKKAIFFHANAITKRMSGYSYSPREWKTAYFRRCYEKYQKLPVEKDRVLFLSERKAEENSNLLCVYRKFAEQKHLHVELSVNPTTVDKLSMKEIRRTARQLAVSRMVILEDFYPQLHVLKIRKETEVVQLWHACGAFKTFGFSRMGKKGGPSQSSPNHRSYDWVFVSGEQIAPIYAEAFAIPDDHVRALGVPRTDLLFQEDYKQAKRAELFSKYPGWTGKKIILFAPTFRGDGNRDAYYPEERFSVEAYMKELPEDVVLLVKHHPFVKQPVSIPEQWRERVFDMSREESMNDLLLVTDLLITDYSSSIFEAAILQVPMLFYVFDREEYLGTRDVYYDFAQFVPGVLAENLQELSEATKACLEGDSRYAERHSRFCQAYLDALDGHSTERIGDFLLERMA